MNERLVLNRQKKELQKYKMKINDIFCEFALAFIGQKVTKEEIAFPNKLNRKDLAFSLNSLKTLDKYLEYLHKNQKIISDNEWRITILRAGAYLGEVIRKNSKSAKSWIDYNDYVPNHPHLANILGERTTSTCAFVCNEMDNMTMPLNKIARFIDEGSLHNTHYYASLECDN